MSPQRFDLITSRYSDLSIAVVGDVCLDRNLENDGSISEDTLETGLRVHNVVNVRNEVGGAGAILNNLVALGVGKIHAVGFCGRDGEGYELERALNLTHRIYLAGFLQTPLRRTFTYTKPLLVETRKVP